MNKKNIIMILIIVILIVLGAFFIIKNLESKTETKDNNFSSVETTMNNEENKQINRMTMEGYEKELNILKYKFEPQTVKK